MDVFNQRLEQEYGAQVVLTAPNVPVKVKIIGAKNIKAYGAEVISISNPAVLPEASIIQEMYEPYVLGTIITPGNCLIIIEIVKHFNDFNRSDTPYLLN